MRRIILKKIISLMVVLLIVLSVFVGCQNGNNNKSSSEAGNINGDLLLPKLNITEEKVTYLTWDSSSGLTDPNNYFYEINNLMKQKYNCELEFIRTTYAELPTKVAQMVMSGSSPDLIKYKGQDFPNFIYNDLVQPIDSYINFDTPLWQNVKAVNDQYKINGKYYFPISQIHNDSFLFYNVKMFEDLALDTPLDLYKKGEWTWSKMIELANQLTVDTNGDGKTDVYGFTMHPIDFYISCGSDFVKTQPDGEFINNIDDPNLAKAMNFVYNTGYKDECRDTNFGNAIQAFTKGTTAMLWGAAWILSTFSDQMEKGEFAFAPTPKMDNSNNYYVQSRIEGAWIAKGAKNPGGAIAYTVITRYMLVDATTKQRLREKDTRLTGFTPDIYNLQDEMDSSKFTFVVPRMLGVGNWGNDQMWIMWNEIGQFGDPWSTCIQKYSPLLQSEIDNANSNVKAQTKK